MVSVSRKSTANRGERRAEVARRLRAAVEDLIETESFTRLSIEKLASHAGIARSTFYAHFADKGELLRFLFVQIDAGLQEANQIWWDLGPVTHRDLRSALESIVEAYRPHRQLIAAAFDVASYDAATRCDVEQAMERSISNLAAHIQRGQHEGWVDQVLLARETASWLMWMIESGQRQLIDYGGADPSGIGIDDYSHLLWSVLYEFACSDAPRTTR